MSISTLFWVVWLSSLAIIVVVCLVS